MTRLRVEDARNLLIVAAASLTVFNTPRPCHGTIRGQHPSLVRRLRSSYTINPSDRPVFMECQFLGEPEPNVTWRLDDDSIPETVRSKGPYVDTNGYLVLRKADPSDSGLYTCIGTNRIGNASASTYITITDSDSPPLWQLWWMWFVYAGAVWVLLSLCLLAIFCCRYHTTNKKLVPINRDERSDSDTSRDHRQGYLNTSYTARSTQNTNGLTRSSSEPVELEAVQSSQARDSSFIRGYQEMATGASAGSQSEIRSSGRRKSSNASYVDAKLQLVEVPSENTSSQRHQVPQRNESPPLAVQRPTEAWVEY